MTLRNLLFVFFCLCSAALFSCQRESYYAFSAKPSAYHGYEAKEKAADKACDMQETPDRPPADASAALSPVPEPSQPQARYLAPAVSSDAPAVTPKQKVSWAQQLLVKKALKLAAKATAGEQKVRRSQPEQVQKPQLDQNLKLFLIFLIVACIASLFSGLLGLLLFVVALVFLLLWVMTL